jgi:hypothetical protein
MSFDSLLCDTVVLVHLVPQSWGETTEVLESGVICRIEYGNRLVRDLTGELVLSTVQGFFKKNANIDFTTKVRVNGADHSIINIQKPSGYSNIHHIEVFLN